jgi:hypothetical protein
MRLIGACSRLSHTFGLTQRYGTGSTKNKAANNSQSVAQFLGQFYRQTDLEEFNVLFARDNIRKRPTIVGPDRGFAGVEASLDIEYIMAGSGGLWFFRFYLFETHFFNHSWSGEFQKKALICTCTRANAMTGCQNNVLVHCWSS